MTKSMATISTVLPVLLALGLQGNLAVAADIESAALPAVSAINGKVQLGGGFADHDTVSSDEVFYGAASLSMPLGDMFGLQADIAASDAFGETAMGGAVHVFTRDPASHLLGVIAGAGEAGNANVAWAGGEAEFYLDRISLEMAAGYMKVNPNVGSNSNEFFAQGDVAFYPVDNLRMSLGGASMAGFQSANVAAEYMLDAMPVSFNLKGEIGEDNYSAVSAGVSFYFGGDDSAKSLIRRHREDDPKNLALGVSQTGAAAFVEEPNLKCRKSINARTLCK